MPPAALSTQRVLAPGARVEARDEEWVVRSVRPASHGGQAVHVTGISELVRGREAIFLTALDDVDPLLPQETQLVDDESPRFRRSRLYLESLLRRTPPTDDALYVGHRAALNPTTYQEQPAAKALRQPRPRILMADGVGLGKTIEAGILLSELIARSRGERILVVVLKSLLAQFQKELWARFTLPLVRLDSVGIQRLRTKIPTGENPFYFYDRVIISIDTLKKDRKYRRWLENARWDAIVIDECQNVADRGSRSLRYQLAREVGFDTSRAYAPGDPDLEDLLAQRVHLQRRDADLLGVDERCPVRDLMTETPVRWYDADHPPGHDVPLWALRYSDPALEPRRERTYPTPWTRCDREADYRRAWEHFEPGATT